MDYLKQKLKVYANRLKRYMKSYRRRTDNNLFIKNQRTVLLVKEIKLVQRKMAALFDEILKHSERTPLFLTTGNTFLLSKTSPSQKDPSKYLPITCLPTLYNIPTSIIAKKIYTHMSSNQVLVEEQKGYRQKAKGCKEQLIIDTIINEEVKEKKSNLYIAYIDYKKAFDSIPHSWLIECLQMYKVDTQLLNSITELMGKWKDNNE